VTKLRCTCSIIEFSRSILPRQKRGSYEKRTNQVAHYHWTGLHFSRVVRLAYGTTVLFDVPSILGGRWQFSLLYVLALDMKKGKLYRVIWKNLNSERHAISMHTKYQRKTVYVWNGDIIMYLGNRLNRYPHDKTISWRVHKFLYGSEVLTWHESVSSVNPALRMEDTFELVEITKS